jgi:hypothetical protein
MEPAMPMATVMPLCAPWATDALTPAICLLVTPKTMESKITIAQTKLKTMTLPPFNCTICSQFNRYSEKNRKKSRKTMKKTFDTTTKSVYNDDIKNQAFVFQRWTRVAGFIFSRKGGAAK